MGVVTSSNIDMSWDVGTTKDEIYLETLEVYVVWAMT